MTEPKRGAHTWASGFLALPSTSAGTWSARLLLLSLVLMLLNTTLVLPAIEQRPGFELTQSIVSSVIMLCVLATGATGLFGLVRERERSWVAILAVLFFGAVIAFLVPDLIIHG